MFMGEKTMTALERTQKVINDLQRDGLIIGCKRILHKEIEGREIFVIALYNDIAEARTITGAIKAEFPNTTRFTYVKEAVAFTIKS